MPVQYTPQFIPTNTQALQGVLSEYQQAYDQNLARELEIQDQYSMIPTVTAEDTAVKNKLMKDFQGTLGELEKKYNYDRASSAYSKELASRIGGLRRNDFWSYNERKKEVAKLDQEMKARLGANYFSPYDPMSATYENQEAINKYRPMDKRDLATAVAATAKEKATSITTPIRNVISLKNPLTGQMEPFVELGEQLGYMDDAEAANFLNSEPGQKWLDEALAGTAFAEYGSNPEIRQLAMQAAMQNLVGERKTSFSRMDIPNTGTDKFPTNPVSGFKTTRPEEVQSISARQGAKAIYKGATTPYTNEEKQFVGDAISGSTMIGQAGRIFGLNKLIANIATSLVPKRDKASADNDVLGYLYNQALVPENDFETQNIQTGITLAKNVLAQYGVSEEEVSPEELFKAMTVYNISGGEKNAPVKALEEITGKSFSKDSRSKRDISRDWNTWWESGGNTIQNKFEKQLKDREQTWVNRTYNWSVKETDKNAMGDFMTSIAKFGKPYFTGLKEIDKNTKGYVTNENMDYFSMNDLPAFLGETGNYKFDYSMSGDDAPFITLTNPKGQSINFEIPMDRMEDMTDLVGLSARLGDYGFGQDVILSRFNPRAGEVTSEINDNIKLAVIDRMKYKAILSQAPLTQDMMEMALSNSETFFGEYDVRKNAKSLYEIKPKSGNEWSGALTKEQLFELIENPLVLEQ